MTADDDIRVTQAPYLSKAFGFLGLLVLMAVFAVVVGAIAAGLTWLIVQTVLAGLDLASTVYGGAL